MRASVRSGRGATDSTGQLQLIPRLSRSGCLGTPLGACLLRPGLVNPRPLTEYGAGMEWITIGYSTVAALLALGGALLAGHLAEKREQRRQHWWARLELYTNIIAYIRVETSGAGHEHKDLHRLADIMARVQLLASKQMLALYIEYARANAADGDQRKTKVLMRRRIADQARDELGNFRK